MTPIDLETLRTDLMREEQLRLSAYTDSRGLLTIGYGRLIDGRVGGGLTKDEADYLFENDIGRSLEGVRRAFPWAVQTLNAVRYRVLVMMVFQLGLDGVRRFTKFLAAAEDGRYDTAAEEMLDSEWATQTPARAQRLATMMQVGRDLT